MHGELLPADGGVLHLEQGDAGGTASRVQERGHPDSQLPEQEDRGGGIVMLNKSLFHTSSSLGQGIIIRAGQGC